jgi:hypothetical protein
MKRAARRIAASGLLALVAAASGWSARADKAPPAAHGIELRVHADGRWANPRGPLAAADALLPGIAPATPSALLSELEWRDSRHARLGGLPLALEIDLLLAHEWPRGAGGLAAGRDRSRVNELNASADLGSWQLAAGRRVVAWDVGYGFRPIDVVQQEERRQLLGSTPQGRPLLQAEYFGAEDALSLVWVNPQHWAEPAAAQRRGDESAFAARAYKRLGGLDLHLLSRWGRHTGWSAGGALAWVATDELELHASARLMHRHEGWALDPALGVGAVARSNPWALQTQGGASQWLIGGQWTGTAQQSLLLEYWHDGSAPSDAQWSGWQARNDALRALAAARPALASAAAGNLAWQATPFDGASLRRDNLFLRLAWQPTDWPAGSWQWTLDMLYHPADAGRIVTAGLQWQGDRVRINAAWRRHGGPDSALLTQLPQRASALLALSWSY